MIQIHPVSSLDLPELTPYRTLRWQAEHRRLGIFVAEGEKVVRRLLESDFPIVSLLLQQRWLDELMPALQRRTENISVYIAEKSVLEKLTGYPLFQGVLAVGKIPGRTSLTAFLSQCPSPRLLVAVEGITNAINIGVTIRNCAAFGVHALLVGETSSSPYLRRAVRNSMGTLFRLPIIETENLIESLDELREKGIQCIAAHPHTEDRTLSRADFTGDCCLVFGSEGEGLSSELLSHCDDMVSIPMPPHVDSLNVGSAGAVFLYEASRQRNAIQAKLNDTLSP